MNARIGGTFAALASAGGCNAHPASDVAFGPASATDDTAGETSATTEPEIEPELDATGADATSSAGDGAGPKLDVAPPEEDSGCGPEGCAATCTAVDLLFVIDNSTSMLEHQLALADAFPTFAEAIVAALPPSTDLHVGVTSTEMGFSAFGVTSTTMCVATGDDGLPQDAFYVTPDEEITETEVAQGRLHVVDGLPFFAIDTSADPAQLQALSEWFTQAASLGVSGSTIEMSAAAAGWATSPANAATNAGFIRDGGAVLFVFFIQDEPDQTPVDTAPELLEMIAAAKSDCGGLDCVVAGGLVEHGCLPDVALGAVLEALPRPPVVAPLPSPQQVTPAVFEEVLADTLVEVIAQTCDEIGPAG